MFMDRELNIRIPQIGFDMPITDLIMELEQLRYKELSGTTHPIVFNQMKNIFQMLESIGSSRIEGNNTTIMDYAETAKIYPNNNLSEHEDFLEILNIEKAMAYIEENIDDTPITSMFIRELHHIAVNGLSARKEGAVHPGQYRNVNVKIGGSSHVPPDYTQVEYMMQSLVDFINQQGSRKYDLLKIAIAHHRFVWIHPFENGNGRVVRLLTYAMLLKKVFKSNDRIINPTAVFCSNRDNYYKYLSMADTGTDEGLIAWSEYMLTGLKKEMVKIDKLVDYKYLKDEILVPSLQDALQNKFITDDDYKILLRTINKDNQELQAGDLKAIFNNASYERSRMIKKLISNGMLMPISSNARKYVISFANNYLLRSVLKVLDKKGFLPEKMV